MGRTENPSHYIEENMTCKWCSKHRFCCCPGGKNTLITKFEHVCECEALTKNPKESMK